MNISSIIPRTKINVKLTLTVKYLNRLLFGSCYVKINKIAGELLLFFRYTYELNKVNCKEYEFDNEFDMSLKTI